ncbi:Nucleoside-diphosphate-sugar epimerase [Sandaracinus amylolyticus]|uniref:Nucleoside-diphosphate-sugar epimerase n=1 Tax=Sandaracinus amylolyticus TaxID=927083 RepID=A0A0F6W8N1_9BACT|nr:Nucleoside-diphosphate-sugar epimerase [Sandaracinus amylolyticus]
MVLGAGQIGTAVARFLAERGHRVRLVARSGGAAIPGVERVRGSVADPAFAAECARGAEVVYSATNVPYDRWHRELAPLVEGAIVAAKSAGARLVVLDNLYAFGRMGGAPMGPEGPFEPCSRKGVLRKQLAERVLAAHHAGEVEAVIARASDFVGPEIVGAHLGERFFTRVLAGSPGECLGDADLPHAFTYGRDVVRGLAALGRAPDVAGRIWHLPTLEARSMRAWGEALGRELGVDVRITKLAGWLLAIAGVVVPIMRELREMTYQWEAPYLVDDSAFRRVLGIEPTPFDEQVRATAAWARAKYGAEATARAA